MTFKIELSVSEEDEGTDSPWWVILDPQADLSLSHDSLASMVTGPFFSRNEAQNHLYARWYAFSKQAVVYCMSGHNSTQYRKAYLKAQEGRK